MTRDERIEKFLNLNLEAKKEIVNDINNIGYELEYLRDYVDFTEDNLNELLQNNTPADIVRMTAFGTINYTDDYIRIDAYDNLVSFNNYNLEKDIDSDVEKIVDLAKDYNIEF